MKDEPKAARASLLRGFIRRGRNIPGISQLRVPSLLWVQVDLLPWVGPHSLLERVGLRQQEQHSRWQGLFAEQHLPGQGFIFEPMSANRACAERIFPLCTGTVSVGFFLCSCCSSKELCQPFLLGWERRPSWEMNPWEKFRGPAGLDWLMPLFLLKEAACNCSRGQPTSGVPLEEHQLGWPGMGAV